EDQNSALHVMAAAALLPANWPFMPASLTMEPAADRSAPRFMSRGYPEMRLVQQLSKLEAIHQLDEDLDKGLRAELKLLAPALRKMRPVMTMSQGRFPITWAKDVLSTPLPHAREVHQVSRLFWLQAALDAQDGKLDDALAAIRGVLNTGRSVGFEPSVLSQAERISARNKAINGLIRVLAQGEASEPALRVTQEMFEKELEVAKHLLLLVHR